MCWDVIHRDNILCNKKEKTHLCFHIIYMHFVQCTLYTVHCTLYSVHCTVYTVHCTLYIICSTDIPGNIPMSPTPTK